jgi:uncharacterized protein (TIGR02611 family)
MRKTGVTILGWVLLIVGLAAIPLPGPGVLITVAGLVVLSQEYEWAERRVEPVKKRAIEGAKSGVSSYPRIALSAVSACVVIGVGLWWSSDPDIPEIGPIGPDLPLGGWATGSGIVLSGLVALALLVYSIKRWHRDARRARKAGRSPSATD